MTIIPLEEAAGRSARSNRRQCERGAQLQALREAAGLSREELAWRDHVLFERRRGAITPCAREGTCSKVTAALAKRVERVERMSQGVYERRLAAARDVGGEAIFTRTWEEYEMVVELGGPELDTREQICAAWDRAEQARRAEKREAEIARERDAGDTLARITWNAAEDPRFLDQILAGLIGEAADRCADAVMGDLEQYTLRRALLTLAKELRIQFPSRQPMTGRTAS